MIASTSSHPSPFTRDRTNLFLSYRASSIRSSPYSSSVVNGKGKGRAHTYEDEEGMEERKGLMEQDEMIDLERGNAPALPPQWVDIGEQVDSILDGIKPKSTSAFLPRYSNRLLEILTYRNIVAQLDKLHAKHVLPGFTDRSAEERDINNLTNDITKVCSGLFRWNMVFRGSLVFTPAGLSNDAATDTADCRDVEIPVVRLEESERRAGT